MMPQCTLLCGDNDQKQQLLSNHMMSQCTLLCSYNYDYDVIATYGGVMAHSLVSQLQELESPVVAELLVRHKPLLIVYIQ